MILKVYDFTGREVKTLMACEQPTGEYTVKSGVTRLPGGVYFYQLQVNGVVETKKMLISK